MENLQNLFNPLYTMTDKELAEKLGEYIKKRRIMMKLTQQELANKAGISRSQLVKIEKDGKGKKSHFSQRYERRGKVQRDPYSGGYGLSHHR